MKHTIDNFWRMIEKTEAGCWLWKGKLYPNGYAEWKMMKLTGERYVHRVSYVLARGRIEEGMELDHTCRTRHCVNPDHLEPVTKQENAARGWNVLGTNRGQNHHKAKLTDGQVEEIRKLHSSGSDQKLLAQTYGVSQSTISNLCRGKYRTRATPTEEEAAQSLKTRLRRP